MPAAVLWGRRWHFATDIIPIPAAIFLTYHLTWTSILLLGASISNNWPSSGHPCASAEGRTYLALFSLFFAACTFAVPIDLLLIIHGLKGTPFEPSKRKLVVPLLYILTVPFAVQSVATIFGTWVVNWSERPDCWESSQWDGIVVVAEAMVYSSWGLLIIMSLGVLVFYNAYRDYESVRTWEKKLLKYARWLCCTAIIKHPPGTMDDTGRDEDDNNNDNDKLRSFYDRKHPPLRSIAELSSGILSHADLDVTDMSTAVMLTAAAQQRRRRLAVAKALLPVYQALKQAQMRIKEEKRERRRRQQEEDGDNSTDEEDRRLDEYIRQLGKSSSTLLSSVEKQEEEQGLRDRQINEEQKEEEERNGIPTDEKLAHLLATKGTTTTTTTTISQQECILFPEQEPGEREGAEEDQPPPLSLESVPTAVVDQLGHIIEAETKELGSDIHEDVLKHGGKSDNITTNNDDDDGGDIKMINITLPSSRRSISSSEIDIDPQQPTIWFPVKTEGEGEWGSGGGLSENEEKGAAVMTGVDMSRASLEETPMITPTTTAFITGGMDTGISDGGADEKRGGGGTAVNAAPSHAAAHRTKPPTPLSPQQLAELYLDHHTAVPPSVLEELQSWLKYAFAVYSLKPKLERPHGILDILAACSLSGPPDPQTQIFRAMRQMEALEEEEEVQLLHLNCSNAVLTHLPYMIALDHRKKAVVLAVRGTFSIADLVTDAVVYPEPIDEWLSDDVKARLEEEEEEGEEKEDGEEERIGSSSEKKRRKGNRELAHAGMIAAARSLFEDMRERGILQELTDQDSNGKNMEEFTGSPSSSSSPPPQQQQQQQQQAPTQQERPDRNRTSTPCQTQHEDEVESSRRVGNIMRQKIKEEGWQFVVVGHSLGAGAAALVSLKLRQFFPSLKCIAFCPPGGTVSKAVAHAMSPFTTSVVVGKDAVSRMSVATLARLMDEMVVALARCKQLKLKVTFAPWWRRNKQKFNEFFYDYNEIPEEALEIVRGYYESRARLGAPVKLYPPGRLVFLRPHHQHKSNNKSSKRVWDAVWIAPEDIIAEGVLVSRRMFKDHLCSKVKEALTAATNKMKRGRGREGGGEEEEEEEESGNGGGGTGIAKMVLKWIGGQREDGASTRRSGVAGEDGQCSLQQVLIAQ